MSSFEQWFRIPLNIAWTLHDLKTWRLEDLLVFCLSIQLWLSINLCFSSPWVLILRYIYLFHCLTPWAKLSFKFSLADCRILSLSLSTMKNQLGWPLRCFILTSFILAATGNVDKSYESADFWHKYSDEELQQVQQTVVRNWKAKNVILFIGDGFGLSEFVAARIFQGNHSKKRRFLNTNFESNTRWS